MGDRQGEAHQHASTVAAGQAPHHLAVAPNGRFAYVADSVAGAVTRIPTGVSPTSVSVLPDGRQALVTSFDEGAVRLIDIAAA